MQRYWKLTDDLSLEAIECPKSDGGVVSSSDRKAVIAFLSLSEDEMGLRPQRWISAGSALGQRGQLGAMAGWDGSSTGPMALRCGLSGRPQDGEGR